jgi:hypothetical protein
MIWRNIMKRYFLAILLLASAISVFGLSRAEYFLQVADRATNHTRGLTEEGYDYDGSCCFFGCLLETDKAMEINYYLEEGVEYKIWAFGDDDMEDLDLTILDAEGEEVDSDKSVSADAEVLINPSDSDFYVIQAENYESSTSSFVLFGIMRYVGENPEDEPGQSCVDALELTRNSIDELENGIFDVNQVFLIGGIMESGETSGYSSYTVPDSERVHVLTQGSDNASDIDVKLTRQEDFSTCDPDYNVDDAELMSSDNSTSNTARIEVDLSTDSYYALKYRNYSSLGRAFVFNLIYHD